MSKSVFHGFLLLVLDCSYLVAIYLLPKSSKNVEKLQKRVYYMPKVCNLNPSNQEEKARFRM